MPPERKVPEMSRALAADTCRTPQPTTHTASTASHSHRAYAISSDHRRRVEQGPQVTRGRRQANPGAARTALSVIRQPVPPRHASIRPSPASSKQRHFCSTGVSQMTSTQIRKRARPRSLVVAGLLPLAGLLGVITTPAHATSADDAFLAALKAKGINYESPTPRSTPATPCATNSTWARPRSRSPTTCCPAAPWTAITPAISWASASRRTARSMRRRQPDPEIYSRLTGS